jgi:hypothetical protein
MPNKSKTVEAIELQTQLPINTNLGTIHHPDSVCHHAAALCDTLNAPSTIYSSARQLLQTFGRELSAVHEADKMVRTPRPGAKLEQRGQVQVNSVDPAMHDQFVEGLNASFDRCGRALAQHKPRIVESLAMLDRGIETALKDTDRNSASVAAQHGELRALVRSSKSPMSEVAAMIAEGDKRSVAAVLDASPRLSGLTAAQHATLRQMAEQRLAPDLFLQREAGRAVLAHLDVAANDLVARFRSYRPAPNAAKASDARHVLDDLLVPKKAA